MSRAYALLALFLSCAAAHAGCPDGKPALHGFRSSQYAAAMRGEVTINGRTFFRSYDFGSLRNTEAVYTTPEGVDHLVIVHFVDADRDATGVDWPDLHYVGPVCKYVGRLR